MRPISAVLVVFLMLAAVVRAAPVNDPELTRSLQICQSNGIEAFLANVYADRPKFADAIREKLAAMTTGLGNVIDTEVLAVQPVGKRLTRIYVAVYFLRRPLWLRIDRYVSKDQTYFLPLRFSLDSDEILPAYITDFPP